MEVEALSAKPRLRLLLDHFSKIKDTRQSWKVAYPLREVLFLVVCGTIASGDDYEDIVDWGKAHLSCLRTSGLDPRWARPLDGEGLRLLLPEAGSGLPSTVCGIIAAQ